MGAFATAFKSCFLTANITFISILYPQFLYVIFIIYFAARILSTCWIFQVEELKLSPGTGGRDYSSSYSSLGGLVFSSNGATYRYSSQHSYYELAHLFDSNIKNAYIVQSSYATVKITVSLPWKMHVHHVRLYPVGLQFYLFIYLFITIHGNKYRYIRQ